MRRRYWLTALIVIVIMAIYVVGFFLVWDVFGFDNKITDFLNHDFSADSGLPDSNVKIDTDVSGITLSADEEKLISDYFTFYYAGLGSLRAEKISRFFAFQCDDELLDCMALDYEISLSESAGLTYDSADIYIGIGKRVRHEKTKTVEIELSLTSEVTYNGFSSPSVTRGEKHYFELDISENPEIIVHTTDRFSRYLSELAFEKAITDAGYIRSDLAYTYLSPYIKAGLQTLTAKNDKLYESFPDDDVTHTILPTAEYSYDRALAVSEVNAGLDNSIFLVYEQNDANFISQCIFNAGVPMDSQGDNGKTQWKWYDPEINNSRKKRGCTESWFDREKFYEYILNNSGFGLVAFDCPRNLGDGGDVIQLLYGNHSVLECMVVGVIKDDSGKIEDYIISTDCYTNMPLRLLGAGDFRLIKIVGYNTANI